MGFIDLGIFTKYTRIITQKYEPKGTLYCKNDNDEDFYDLSAKHKEKHAWLIDDSNNEVVSSTDDISSLFPEGYRLVVGDDPVVGDDLIWSNGEITQHLRIPTADQAEGTIEKAVETRRQQLSSPLAAKRDHYKLIADLAQQALTDPSALALLATEAAARGMGPEDLRDLVIVKAGLWQQADQALAALEAAGRNAVIAATQATIKDVLNGYLSQIESVGAQ